MMLNKEQMLEELYDAYEFLKQAERTKHTYSSRNSLLAEERAKLEKPPVWFYILYIFVPLYIVSLFRRFAEGLVAVLIFTILIVGFLTVKKLYKKTPHYAKRVKEFKQKEEELKALKGEVVTNGRNARGSVSFLSREYWNTNAIGCMIGYLRSNRASTVADMVNLYENEMHQRRMEDIQQEILREEKLQTEIAQEPQYVYVRRY